MSAKKHTPGPWTAAGDPIGIWVNASEGAVARVYSTHKLDGFPPIEREYPQLAGETNARANADLIAAAPELLEALKQMVANFKAHMADYNEPLEMPYLAQTAIARAEGRALPEPEARAWVPPMEML